MNKTALSLLLLGLVASAHPEPVRPNVLFIAIDDLRSELGCYGVSKAISSHMDSFAESARLFKNHDVSVPTSARHFMLTGIMPMRTGDVKNSAGDVVNHWSDEHVLTMPELFRRNGYRTVSMGKFPIHQPAFISTQTASVFRMCRVRGMRS